MNKTFKCSICGKEFTDVTNYVSHVSKCAEDYKKKETENLQKLNEDLNRVKAAKAYYEDQLSKFKENYPEAYKLNFGELTKSNLASSKNIMNTAKRPSGVSNMDVTINGQKIPDEVVEEALTETMDELKGDPFVHHMLKVLNLLD